MAFKYIFSLMFIVLALVAFAVEKNLASGLFILSLNLIFLYSYNKKENALIKLF